jgi:antitoxin HigA-1
MPVAVHPGRLLRREMVARKLSANRLALDLGVPSGRVTDIINSKRGITADTALRLGRRLGTSAQFWMNLQTRYDLTITEEKLGRRLAIEVRAA